MSVLQHFASTDNLTPKQWSAACDFFDTFGQLRAGSRETLMALMSDTTLIQNCGFLLEEPQLLLKSLIAERVTLERKRLRPSP